MPRTCIFQDRCGARCDRRWAFVASTPCRARRRPVRPGGDRRWIGQRLAGSRVDHDRAIGLAFVRGMFGDVRDPQLIGAVWAELAGDQIVVGDRVGVAPSGPASTPSGHALRAISAHQAFDAFAADAHAEPEPQLGMHARASSPHLRAAATHRSRPRCHFADHAFGDLDLRRSRRSSRGSPTSGRVGRACTRSSRRTSTCCCRRRTAMTAPSGYAGSTPIAATRRQHPIARIAEVSAKSISRST
jgi:hypothetical protein